MIVACWKWTDHRPEVDRLSGEVRCDPRSSGPSPADEAALEWALRLGAARDEPVVVVTAGPPAAEPMLHDALAVGADRVARVDLDDGLPSAVVAAALADVAAGAAFVVTGDASLDRGSGSVPAFLAHRLGAAQALGLVSLTVVGDDVVAERRLDGGRRERLRIGAPAVVSVEAASARLRRAPLPALLRARQHPIERSSPAMPADGRLGASRVVAQAFRPRPKVLPGPDEELSARERILFLTGALAEQSRPELVSLAPDDAADRILAQLRTWGYLV